MGRELWVEIGEQEAMEMEYRANESQERIKNENIPL
jgi:hypothetical protein